MIKNTVLALAGITSLALPSMASAAVIVLEEDNGTFTGTFSDRVRAAGPFTLTYTFDLPTSGTTALTATTIRVGADNTMGDIDFTSVTFNGDALSLTGEVAEYAFGQWRNVAGTQTLVINGTSYGNAGVSGVVTFAAGVPEPATWAIMLLGFAATGFAMRRRKSTNHAVSYAF